MNFFTFDFKKMIVLVAIIAIPLISINMQKNETEDPWFTRPFSFVGGVLQQVYSGFTSGVRGTTTLYLDLIDIKKQNRVLIRENAELRAQLGALTELKLENERLNKLLGFKQQTNMELLAAKVIGKDLMPEHASITINRGTRHGVKKNMAGITIGGVVGYVIMTEPLTSQILLLTDSYATIDAIVQRSRARGILEGQSKSCRLNHLQRDDDVKVGDLIVTSGLMNVFPKGFPIGTVTNVERNRYGMSQTVDVKPAINPFTLEELFIILDAKGEDLSPTNQLITEPEAS